MVHDAGDGARHGVDPRGDRQPCRRRQRSRNRIPGVPGAILIRGNQVPFHNLVTKIATNLILLVTLIRCVVICLAGIPGAQRGAVDAAPRGQQHPHLHARLKRRPQTQTRISKL